MIELPDWLKSRGYLHISPQIDTRKNAIKLLRQINNEKFITQHAFYPLIHATIKNRRYKKDKETNVPSHFSIKTNGQVKSNAKERPLHYATHLDAIIFGCYAEKIQKKYEEHIGKVPELNNAITAYRKIPIPDDPNNKNKSTIHYAKEVFDEIKSRSQFSDDLVVLAFDIKSFFSSIDHKILYEQCAQLLGEKRLKPDYFAVLKAATRFSYILKDDFRKGKRKLKGRKAGFDEKYLAKTRKEKGINTFFDSPKAFRDSIKSGELKIYKNPFKNKQGKSIGIPQGLPISAILANLYLLKPDSEIVQKLVIERKCFYRRYSDDIIVICKTEEKEFVEKFVTEAIDQVKVEISKEKTEVFYFTNQVSNGNTSLHCYKETKGIRVPALLTYLGFEFNGRNTFIKSQNLSKFYRKMIYAVKGKANKAKKLTEMYPWMSPVIFKRQLYKTYADIPLDKIKVHHRWKTLVRNERGDFVIKSGVKIKQPKSNYMNYVKRASEIMNEPKIYNQIRKHYHILHSAMHKHLSKIKK
jgi:hypothetical protein